MSNESWEVETIYGPVSGEIENGIGIFLGIPYAAAPTGPRRFGAPVPPQPWSEVFEANQFGPTPPRDKRGLCDRMFAGDPALIGGIAVPATNWLTVNVWTPRQPAVELRPVMVWIHGGAFIRGASAGTAYDGATFARDDVVLVSFNYRLGLDGFGYLPDAPVPANRGLRDQIFVLEWVRDNIANFGGDPGNVTVFGESAGAMSVLTLMSIDCDLFHKAIVQSGSAHIAQRQEDAALVLKAVATELTVEPTAKALGKVPFEDLIKAQQKVHQDIVNTADRQKYGDSTIDSCVISFMPVLDGELLPQPPIEGIRAGAGGNIPLLIGTVVEENRVYVMPYDMALVTDVSQWTTRLAAYNVPDSGAMYDKYASQVTLPYTRSLPAEVFSAVMSDRLFRISSYRVAETRVRGLASTHVFELGWRSPVVRASQQTTADIRLGACHLTDIPFVWDTLDAAGVEELIQDPPKNLAKVMHGRWVEFAKNGELANWPPYNTEGRAIMTFYKNNRDANEIVLDPRSKERQLWDNADIFELS